MKAQHIDKLQISEDEIIKIILEFLSSRSYHDSLRTLERETNITNCEYSAEVLFLRELVLDGQFDGILQFGESFKANPDFEETVFNYIVLRQKFIELIFTKCHILGEHDVDTVSDVMRTLSKLEKICPTKEEYNNLCWLLTLPNLNKHDDFKDWDVDVSRLRCFHKLLDYLSIFLPLVKQHSGVNKVSTGDRLLQLLIKGLYYESCTEYCRSVGTVSSPNDEFILENNILKCSVSRNHDSDLLSWIVSLPEEVFKLPFEICHINVSLSKRNERQYIKENLVNGFNRKIKNKKTLSRQLTEPYEKRKNPLNSLKSKSFELDNGSTLNSSSMHYKEYPIQISTYKRSENKKRLDEKCNLSASDNMTEMKNSNMLPSSTKIEYHPIDKLIDHSASFTKEEVEMNASAKRSVIHEDLNRVVQDNLIQLDTNIGDLMQQDTRNELEAQDVPLSTLSSKCLTPSKEMEGSSVKTTQAGVAFDVFDEYEEQLKNEKKREEILRKLNMQEKNRKESLRILTSVLDNDTKYSEENEELLHPVQNIQEIILAPQQPGAGTTNPTSVYSEGNYPMSTSIAHEQLINGVRRMQTFNENPAMGTSYPNENNIAQYQAISMLKDTQAVRSVCFHPSGRFHAIGANSKILHICSTWPSEKNIEGIPSMSVVLRRSKYHRGSIYCMAWDPEGRYLATGSNDKSIKLLYFNQQTCEQVGEDVELNLHTGTVRDLAFVPNRNGFLISGGAGTGSVNITDVNAQKVVGMFEGHSGNVLTVYVGNIGELVATGGSDNTLRLWDLRSQRCVDVIVVGDSSPASVSLSPLNKYIASGQEDGSVLLYDITAGRTLQSIRIHKSDCRSVRFSPDSKYLMTASYDSTISLMRMNSSVVASEPPKHCTIARHLDKVIQCRWHPSGDMLLSSSTDKTAILWQPSFV